MNDELLSAYLDGELDAEKRQLVELYLAQNVGAALRLENLKRADDLMRDAIPRITIADDPIARMILSGERPKPRLRVVQTPWVRAAASMAAACVMGVLVGIAATSGRQPTDDLSARMRIGPQLAAILDTTPAGGEAPVMGGQAQVALSLQTAGGRYCRQFRLTEGDAASDAVACRDDGRWRMIVEALVPRDANGAYHTAAADEGSAVDVAITGLGSSIVLDEREEREAIANHWRAAH